MNFTQIIAFLLLTLGSHSVGTAAVFINLGDLPGGDFFSQANAISADGSTVVGYSKFSGTFGFESVNNADQAFRWSLSTGMVGLGDLTGGTWSSQANGVSGDGSVIVGGSDSTPGNQAFRWTSGSEITGIGDLIGGSFFSQANDVSADGTRIVGVSESSFGTEAFQYTSGGMLGMGDLPGGTFNSSANAVSDNGLVIVGQSDSSNSDNSASGNFDEAFRNPVFGTMTGLGILPSASFFCPCEGSGATAVSADGSVVVGWSSDTYSPVAHFSFRWTQSTGIQELHSIDGLFSSIPNDMSADGSIVIGAYGTGASSSASFVLFPEDDHEAFIWSESDGIKNLQQVFEDDYGLVLTDWTLESATGISADGSVITGYGINPAGNREAWVVDLNAVPEPSTAVLLILGALGFVISRRKFHS